MSELFEIGDRCTVMRDGQYIDTLELTETDEAQLTRLMVGRDISFSKMENLGIKPDHVSLEVRHLRYRDFLKNISFELKKGEILGVAGLVGAGRTELAKCIIGAYHTENGEILLEGEPIRRNSIPETIKKGIVYLSEDRKDEGLVLMHSVLDNITLPTLSRFGKVLLNKNIMLETSLDSIKKLRIKTPDCMCETKNLSGGNQQKVVIAKWLNANAKVYIFDEPTRGIDVGARDEIYHIMHDLTQSGASILMISSDLVEVLKMCDRVMVMREGEIAGILDNSPSLTQEILLSYALHGGNRDGKHEE